MTEIQIHNETFRVHYYRRNYKRCRACHARTGTIIYGDEPITVTFQRSQFQKNFPEDFPDTEQVRIVAICERCGRRWVPTTGRTLRAMGVHS
jgi:site-specific DNA-adenine methylase